MRKKTFISEFSLFIEISKFFLLLCSQIPQVISRTLKSLQIAETILKEFRKNAWIFFRWRDQYINCVEDSYLLRRLASMPVE